MAARVEKRRLLDEAPPARSGGASFTMIVVTMLKVCVGTGVLAVPHAFSEGGVLPSFVMLFALLCWNDWSANRLVDCRALLDARECAAHASQTVESPLAALARVAGGPRTAVAVEACLALLMFGVATAYFVAAHDFLGATPAAGFLARAPGGADVFGVAALAFPLSLVEDLGALAYAGAAGLGAIFVSFCCIAEYGLAARAEVGWAASDDFRWYAPRDAPALAAGFGVLAYCFGVPPLALQLEASMAEPRSFKRAQRLALGTAFLAYAATGAGVARLFDGLPGTPTVAGNVLDDLPRDGGWGAPPAIVRVAMALVCVFSAPLGIVSCGQIFEARLGPPTPTKRRLVRGGITFGAAAVASALPVFALVVALVGCLAVSLLSFVLPPVLHLQLLLRGGGRGATLALDGIAIVVGVVVVVFTTFLTARSVAAQLDAAPDFENAHHALGVGRGIGPIN